jgi:hypothetical protein
MQDCAMPVEYKVEQRDGYMVVRVIGDPALGEFLQFIEQLGRESAAWKTRRALVDLRSVRSLKSFTEHYAVGEAAARHLAHLDKLASVVPADRITRASEKTAQRSGFNLVVFTDEGAAIAWLAAG